MGTAAEAASLRQAMAIVAATSTTNKVSASVSWPVASTSSIDAKR